MPTKITLNRPSYSYWTETYEPFDGPLLSKSAPISYSWVCDTVKTGEDNPKYKTQMAIGQNASTRYSLLRYSVEAPLVNFYADVRTSRAFRYRHVGWPLSIKPGLPTYDGITTRVKGASIAKFYAKFAETAVPFKGQVFLGEIKQTRDTVASYLLLAVDSYNALRRDVRGLAVQLKNELRKFAPTIKNRRKRKAWIAGKLKAAELKAAQRYLEFTFGVEPLLMDIEALYGVLCDERKDRVYINAVVTDSEESSSSSEVRYCNNLLVTTAYSYTQECRSKCKGAYDLSKPATANPLRGTADSLGLSLKEVVPSLWELTPYSFLIDYFLNVGDLLNTAIYCNTAFVYADCSTRTSLTSEYKLGKVRPDPQRSGYVVKWDVPPTSVVLRRFAFQRVPVDPREVSIDFSVPPIGRRWVNMLALLIQKAGK